MKHFKIDDNLRADTKLYRYLSIESFIAFVESRCIHLSNVNDWDDKWEAILSKVPTEDDDGNLTFPIYSFHEGIVGQCWTLLPESDAMWRIYSPTQTGILISTTANKFRLIEGIERVYVGLVVYFDDVQDLLAKSENMKGSVEQTCLKRSAFKHEQEVRLLSHCDFATTRIPGARHLNLPLDPILFIEGIKIDSRAPEWYVNTIQQYCARVGFTSIPERSRLYEPDPQLKLGIAQKWVPVAGEEKSVPEDST